MFNKIKTENQVPIPWQVTTVKSIYKGGVKENIQENQRGIFLINTVSKIYERALKYKMKRKMRKCHKCKQQEENNDQQ